MNETQDANDNQRLVIISALKVHELFSVNKLNNTYILLQKYYYMIK